MTVVAFCENSVQIQMASLACRFYKIQLRPAGGAQDAPSDSLVGWRRDTFSLFPIPYPFDAFRVSLSTPSASNLGSSNI